MGAGETHAESRLPARCRTGVWCYRSHRAIRVAAVPAILAHQSDHRFTRGIVKHGNMRTYGHAPLQPRHIAADGGGGYHQQKGRFDPGA